jgi:branched-chain amino acid transport system substrate-binding protein
MNTRFAWRSAALVAFASIAMASSAMADDKVVKIGVLNDMSSLYADIGGPGSVAAVKMAVEDSGLTAKGWKIDVISGDHQNKPDVGVNIARQWIDEQKVDAIADTPNSGVALAVSNVVKEKNAVLLNNGGASADLTGKACNANTTPTTPICLPTEPARR